MCPLFSPRARKNAIIATPEYIAGSQVGSFTVVRYERGKAHKAFIIVISQSSFDDNTYLPTPPSTHANTNIQQNSNLLYP